MLTLGGDGGVMASAHIRTGDFLEVYRAVKADDYRTALAKWKGLAEMIPLLFAEPSPAPIKYLLKRQGLIRSLETRLPIVEVSAELKVKLEKYAEL